MNSPEMSRCWAEIELDALRHNARVAREHVGGGVALMAVIKANAYGHGLATVAPALGDDAELFAVADVQEALDARNVVEHPIVILGPVVPAERAAVIEHGFIASISSLDEAREFSRCTRGASVAIDCAIDTGMGRMGIDEASAVEQLKRIAALPNIRTHSVSTHLPAGDEDAAYTKEQLARFAALISRVRSEVPGNYRVHALPSAGVIGFPTFGYDIVRAGLMIYGISPISEFQQRLRPALTLKTRVSLLREISPGQSISYGRTFIAVRQMRTATLAIGYADGLPRAVSNRGAAVLIAGQRCPILGRVTMDLTVVDVSDVPAIEVGDEAVVIGRQGNAEIMATELAERAGTIAWEIFTGIGTRVARVYE